MPIPPEHAELLGALLEQVDGQRDLRAIQTALGGPEGMPDTQLLELVGCLGVERYLLDLRE